MSETKPIIDIEQLVDTELAGGDPRSLEYRWGMIDVLRFRLHGTPIPSRYRAGTVEYDAYWAGNERGHALFRQRAAAAADVPR